MFLGAALRFQPQRPPKLSKGVGSVTPSNHGTFLRSFLAAHLSNCGRRPQRRLREARSFLSSLSPCALRHHLLSSTTRRSTVFRGSGCGLLINSVPPTTRRTSSSQSSAANYSSDSHSLSSSLSSRSAARMTARASGLIFCLTIIMYHSDLLPYILSCMIVNKEVSNYSLFHYLGLLMG